MEARRLHALTLAMAAMLVLAGCVVREDTAAGSYDFTCDNGWTARISYPQDGSAVLEVAGKTLSLYSVVSASGARYATEQGLTPHDGLIWWEKGSEARLYRMILDDSVTAADYPLLAVCRL